MEKIRGLTSDPTIRRHLELRGLDGLYKPDEELELTFDGPGLGGLPGEFVATCKPTLTVQRVADLPVTEAEPA